MTALELSPLAPEGSLHDLPGLPVRVRIAELRLAPSRREGGVNLAHVRTLTQLQGRWPPIVVARRDRTVVDGLHRVHAAKELGKRHIACVFFDGGPEDIFLEFVRRNVTHGLPLSLRERERAADRVLRLHCDWSDRRIAEVCGLSPTTVARVRTSSRSDGSEASRASAAGRRPSNQSGQLDKRLGRDGRLRPIDSSPLRRRIADALRADPGASLRVVATKVGASPETVRRVRRGLSELASPATCSPANGSPANGSSHRGPAGDLHLDGHDQLDQTLGKTASGLDMLTELVRDDALSPQWAADPAVLSAMGGTSFTKWFGRTHIDSDWRAFVVAVPLSRVYEVADEARRRAACWQQFAANLEARVRGS